MWAMILLLAEVAVAPYMTSEMAPGETFDPEKGWLVHSVSAENGIIVYERPVVLLPARMTVGDVHTSQRRFVFRVDGKKRQVGAHYFEAELLGIDSILGHDDCLKVRRSALRMDYSGQQTGYDVTEWYARGVGIVRAQGKRFWKDADGEVTRSEPISGVVEGSFQVVDQILHVLQADR